MSVELIRVTQLPIIEERLRSMKDQVDQRVEAALSLVCTEETIQAVKAERAALNKEFAALEEQRKAVKAAVMGPYETFEAVYRECVSDAFRRADAALKGKINDTESEMRRRCEEGLREYFAELCAVHHLDWLEYERAGIKVDMASAKAKTPKRLREQLAQFVAGVSESVDRINLLDDAEEIMVEYMRTLDAADAICTVHDRHRRIEEERAAREARDFIKAAEDMAAEIFAQAYAEPPVVVSAAVEKSPDDIIPEMSFTVYNAPRRVLRQIKEILEMEGIRYE